MQISHLKLSFLSLFLIAFIGFSNAQQTYLVNEKESNVLVEGTSNIHDWEIEVEDLESKLEMGDKSDIDIQSITFQVPVKSMDSGKRGMDKNTYKALDADEYEFIKFNSTSVKSSAGKHTASGDLSIAGTTNQVDIPLEISKNGNKINITTSYVINMLDYKIEPPTAMFGTIKTGENVTVKIKLTFNN